MNYQLDFTGKNILITGANGGLGRGMAEGFAALGGTLILTDINMDGLEEFAASLNCKYIAVKADLTKPDEVDALFDAIKQNFDHVDVLMNNAGSSFNTPAEKVTDEQWSGLLNINMDVPFFMATRVAREYMIPQRSGKIVNTASMGGFTGIPTCTAYNASKGALLQITRGLCTEWARFNIQVNALCPGYINTNMTREAQKNKNWMQLIAIRTPMRRIGEVDDVTGAALFLASELANYITGTFIQVDGGAYAGGF